MRAIGTHIQYLIGECETVLIVGYEIRNKATYVIVNDGIFETKVNILNENRVFKFVD